MNIKPTCIALLVSGFTLSSQAAIIPVVTTPPANQGDPTTLAWVNSYRDPNSQLVMLGKWTPANSWSSLVSGVTSANFTVTPIINGNSTATISWNLTNTGYGLYAILGSQSSSVNLNFENSNHFTGSGSVTAPGNGNGWSHISFYGKAGQPGGRVPDGGTTIVSLGIALLGLGSIRRLIVSKG